MASMKKGIYSLTPLAKLLFAANRRYLEFISDIDGNSVGLKILNKISKSIKENNRPYKGFNMFDNDDLKLLFAITSGEFNISGFQNKNLRQRLPDKSCFQISRMLKLLRTHGMIKKISHTYKYYLIKLGREIIISALKMKNFFLSRNLKKYDLMKMFCHKMQKKYN